MVKYFSLFLLFCFFKQSLAQNPEFVIQDGHAQPITALAVKEKEFASIDESGKLVIWDINSKLIKEKHMLHNIPFASTSSQRLKFTPHKNMILFNSHNFNSFVNTSSNSSLTLYDYQKREVANKFSTESDLIYGEGGHLYFYINEYYDEPEHTFNTLIFHRSIIFHYFQTADSGLQLRHQYAFENRICNMVVSSKNKQLAVGFENGHVIMMEVERMEPLWESADFEDRIYDLTFIPGRNALAYTGTAKKYSSSGANYIMIRSVDNQFSKKLIADGKEVAINKVRCSDDGEYMIATGGFHLFIIETVTYEFIFTDKPSDHFWGFHQISDVACLKNSHELIISSHLQLRIFNMDNLQYSDNLNNAMTGFGGQLGFSDQNTFYLYDNSSNKILDFYDLAKLERKNFNSSMTYDLLSNYNYQEGKSLWFPSGKENIMSFQPSDKTLAVWTTTDEFENEENHFLLYTLDSLSLKKDYPLNWNKDQQENYMKLLCLDAELDIILFEGIKDFSDIKHVKTTLYILDLVTGKELLNQKIIDLNHNFLFSPNKEMLVFLDENSELVVLSSRNLKEIFRKPVNRGLNNSPFLFAADGKLLYSSQEIKDSNYLNHVILTDLNNLKEDTLISIQNNGLTCMDYNGNYLAMGLIHDYSLDKWKDSVEYKVEKFGLDFFTDYKLVVLDMESREVIRKIPANLSFYNACILKDDLVLASQFLQQVQLISIKKEDEIDLYRSGKEDIFVSRYNYKSGKSALKQIGVKIDKQVYPVESYDLLYNRPDKLLAVSGKASPALLTACEKAWHKRLVANYADTSSLSVLLDVSKFPHAEFNNRKTFKSVSEKPEVEISVSFFDSFSTLSHWQMQVNGVPLFKGSGKKFQTPGLKSETISRTIKLSEGSNRIKVFVENEHGLRSLPDVITVNYKPKETIKPDIYLITIGVSDYLDSSYNLRYAAKDASDLQKLFSPFDTLFYGDGDFFVSKNYHFNSDAFPLVRRWSLLDDQARRENIMQIRKWLDEAAEDDLILLFISGHGLLDSDGNYFFATHDIDFKNPADKGLSFAEMTGLLEGLACRKRLLFLDTCHSGELDDTDQGVKRALANMQDNQITTSFTKGAYVIQDENVEVYNSFELMKDLFAELNTAGIVVTSASSGLGYAIENDEWQNGVFTYSIIRGLKEFKADKDKNRIISISELRDYVINQVFVLTKGRQKPTSRQENIEFDFRVW